MTKGIALPRVPKVVFTQNAADLHIASWMLDSVYREAKEIQDEAKDI